MTAIETGHSYKRGFVWLGMFAIAMGFLEAIVVVYLRELYYPAGFQFPLKPVPVSILNTEIIREVCTIVMLVSVAYVAARSAYIRFTYFLFIFGLWDIFYYVALKVFLDWPPSLLTWDVLFLIPITWTGPVIAPLVTAVTFCTISLLIAYMISKYSMIRFSKSVWTVMALGALFIFVSFIWDYTSMIIEKGLFRDLIGMRESPAFMEEVSNHVPVSFNWPVYIIGEVLLLASAVLVYRNTMSGRFRGFK
jgi:hypothetical protein